MPYHRFSRPMGRRSSLGTVIRSYKKVLNFAAASHVAATVIESVLVTGVDAIAPGQASPTDGAVPTGSSLKYILIQYSAANATSALAFLHYSVQRLLSGQAAVSPLVVGGNPQRNQVHIQGMTTIGANQNTNRTIKFKIPKKYQRVREGDRWIFNRSADLLWGDAVQIIYKFYQ